MAIIRGSWSVSLGLGTSLLLVLTGCQQGLESAGPKAMQAILAKDYATAKKLAQSVPGLGNYEDRSLKISVLQRAAYAGQPELVDLLIAGGADVNRRAGDGKTVLESALSGAKDPETIKRLIAAKVDVNAVDKLGGTALHYVVHTANVEAVRTLIEGGADLLAKDGSGRTSLEIAHKTREVLTTANETAPDQSISAAAQTVAVKKMAGKDGLAKIDQIILLLETKQK